jgi:predicted negative regulator of RcsB-dependent stress response
MVRSAKRITRKDLRRPDPFVTFTTESLRLLNEHKTLVFLSVSLLLAMLLGVWGWQSYTRSQNLLAAEKFSDAVALYRNKQYEEAIKSLEQVKTYHLSDYVDLALLYQANSHITLNEYDQAVAALREFIKKETKGPLLRQVGFLTLGYAQEKAGRCEEAVNAFSQAHEIAGPRREEALLAKARCQAVSGNFQEALNTYRQHLSAYPNSENKTATSLRIQELGAKVGSSGGGK